MGKSAALEARCRHLPRPAAVSERGSPHHSFQARGAGHDCGHPGESEPRGHVKAGAFPVRLDPIVLAHHLAGPAPRVQPERSDCRAGGNRGMWPRHAHRTLDDGLSPRRGDLFLRARLRSSRRQSVSDTGHLFLSRQVPRWPGGCVHGAVGAAHHRRAYLLGDGFGRSRMVRHRNGLSADHPPDHLFAIRRHGQGDRDYPARRRPRPRASSRGSPRTSRTSASTCCPTTPRSARPAARSPTGSARPRCRRRRSGSPAS